GASGRRCAGPSIPERRQRPSTGDFESVRRATWRAVGCHRLRPAAPRLHGSTAPVFLKTGLLVIEFAASRRHWRLMMKWAALITWVLTAGGGFVLLTIWLMRGGMRQQREAGNRIRPPLIMSHFLLAASGLVVWIIYLAADKDALAWIAFGILAVVALLGWTMFAIWLRRRGAAQPGIVE